MFSNLLFGPKPPRPTKPLTPEQELLAHQRAEIAYLRTLVSELQGQLIALTSTYAYRVTHPQDAETAARDRKPATPSVYEQRQSIHTPGLTLAELNLRARPSAAAADD